jgi:hypothetical protein
MVLTDGSDTFVRHLQLWCCFLPLTEHWSVDAAMDRRRQQKGTHGVTPPSSSGRAVSGLPCLAIVMQIVLMYAGTVFHYTTDLLGGFNDKTLADLKWLPPELSAVHYVMHCTFAPYHLADADGTRFTHLACLFLPATASSQSTVARLDSGTVPRESLPVQESSQFEIGSFSACCVKSYGFPVQSGTSGKFLAGVASLIAIVVLILPMKQQSTKRRTVMIQILPPPRQQYRQ